MKIFEIVENFADVNGLTEALDNPYPFTLQGPDSSHNFAATAETPNGVLRMDFEAIDYDDFSIDFAVAKSMGKTGAGDEFRTFATVVAMMNKWISVVGIEHVEGFDFAANKTEHASGGREKLYARFAKQLAGQLGWKLKQSTTADNSTAFFQLTNPEPIPRDDSHWDDLEDNPDLEENFADGKEIGIHRSAEDFAVIDLSKSADGTFWLNGVDNTDWDNTVTTGQGVDMAFEISPQAKLASYDDIDKYSVGELENMGYDGVRMVDGDNIAYQIWNTKILKITQLGENFADGKKKGKSRPGRVKRAGASCNGSVTALRKRAKNASGEKAKMLHWCANMKSGRKK